MPGLNELEVYMNGLWMLATGRQDGANWLDFTLRGFWRSWWAAFFCLPPTLLSWLAFRAAYVGGAPGTPTGGVFFAKMAIMEAANWVVPTALMALIAIGAGRSRYVIPIIVTTNWLSLPVQWLYSIQSAIQLLFPEGEGASAFLFLILLSLSIGVHFRIIRAVTGGDAVVPAAVVLCLFAGSFLTQYQLTTAFDLWIIS
jgi:hypothetical protein